MAKQAVARKEDSANFFTEYGKVAGVQSNIIGKLLRFTKGEFVAGQDADEIPEGTKLVVNMDSVLTGWQRWEDARPAEQLMGPICEGFQPAKRSDLGFEEKSSWEVDQNGVARDPWQFANLALMKEPGKKGELYTFTTSSKGGLGAIGRLCTEYGNEMREHDGEYPVIELGVGSYKHSNYGKIQFPEFKITGWADVVEFSNATDEPQPAARKKLKIK